MTEGEKGASAKRLNKTTAMKGAFGRVFLLTFFDVLQKIADGDEGFREEDDIWNYHMHGLGREQEILPSQMVNFAKSLNKNMILTAQSVGVKNHFQGQHVFTNTVHENPGNHRNQASLQTHLTSITEGLKNVFNLPHDPDDPLSQTRTTRLFVDVGTNIYPGSDRDYVVPYAQESEGWVQGVLGVNHTTDESEETISGRGTFNNEAMDEIVNFSEDRNEGELNLQAILEDYDPNKVSSYPMMACHKTVSNEATGRIVVVLSRDTAGKLSKILNPRMGKCVSGCQLYCPYTKQFLRGDVRASQRLFNRFPTYMMDLLSGNEALSEDTEDVRKKCASVLAQVEDTLHYLLEQCKDHTRSHVRFEAYFDLTASRKPEWPNVNLLSSLRLVSHLSLQRYLKEICGRTMRPLRKFVQMEKERASGVQTNITAIPPAARTRLFQCAETALMICNPSNYTPKVFESITSELNGVLEVPVTRRSELADDVKDWTGLFYGIEPLLLKFRTSPTPATPHASSSQATSPLARIIASRLNGQVVLPLDFVNSVAKTKQTLLRYQDIARRGPQALDDGWVEEEPSESFGFFDDIDYGYLRNNLTEDQRRALAVDLCRIVISLYEKEWHFYLFAKKKRRANAPNINWPSHANKIEDFPSTYEGIRDFQILEPRSRHIQVPRADRHITTEGKQARKQGLEVATPMSLFPHWKSTRESATSLSRFPQMLRHVCSVAHVQINTGKRDKLVALSLFEVDMGKCDKLVAVSTNAATCL